MSGEWLKNEVPKDASVLGGHFVLTLKSFGVPDEKAKARYVAQGYDDDDKPYIVHDSSTLRSMSIRLILSIAVLLSFRLLSHDVTQAYLQSRNKLTLKVVIGPKGRALKP